MPQEIRLDQEWTRLLAGYREQHLDPRNKACHRVGIPMILASLPIGATVVGLPLAAALFTVGWGFQFLGHHYEGNNPGFFSDSAEPGGRRAVVGRRGGAIQLSPQPS